MTPKSGFPDAATASPVRRIFPPFFVYLVGLALAFELLVALGVIAQPIFGEWQTRRRYAGAVSSYAAVIGFGAYLWPLMRSVRGKRRLSWPDVTVALSVPLFAIVSEGFAQLTTVLIPRTLFSSPWDAPTVRYLLSHSDFGWFVVIVAVAAVASECALRDAEMLSSSHGLISKLLLLTTGAAVLCVFIPIASVSLLDASRSSAAALPAVTTAPSRLGAVSFTVLWMAILVADQLRTSHVQRARVWVYVALLLVVIGLAFGFEPRPIIAIPTALALGALTLVRSRSVRERPSEQLVQFSSADLALVAVFFMSGAAALVYQVVFAKGLALTFGSTSHASTIVLATYMSGLALGSWAGGRIAERITRPILVYAGSELGIAIICALAPLTLKATRALYVAIAAGADPAEPWLVALQLGLGAVVLIPPTLLMGVTMPMLTRHLLARRESLGVSAGVLYSSNTLGAAAGALITGYSLMPTFGVSTSLRIAVALNVIVASIALTLARRPREVTSAPTEQQQDSSPDPSGGDPMPKLRTVLGWIALVQLTVGGFVTFGLETTFVHLLATIAGNSAYAFSLMLFAFLVGLGIGSNVARRWIRKDRDFACALLFCQALLALTLLMGVPYWDSIPRFFSLFGAWAPAKSFVARELVRFLACLVVMLPPALFIGAQFPIAMEVIGRAWHQRRVAALGFASALNTVGNILGALVVGFVMLPVLGSLGTLHLLIVACVFLAALSLPYVTSRLKPAVVALLLVEAALYLKQPVQFDLTSLASGGNVYFQYQHYGRVIDSAESLDGGLTTVAISGEDREMPVLTLLTNGKFQGDDSTGGEMKAQSSFALAPLLHTPNRDRALVIGFGTGTTTKVFHQAGFSRIDVAELSADIVTLADRYFRSVNEGVLHEPEVKIHVTDGRNYLLLDKSNYDVISIELSSIWFAGAANLYNREFYQLVRSRLAPNGVFQQWVQLHRLSEADIATILTTLSEQFPNVWLYFLGKQGILVACQQRCEPSRHSLSALDESPKLASTLGLFAGHAGQVLQGRLLTPATLKRLVLDARQKFASTDGPLVATDDNVVLEYSTPKGNVRPYDESLDKNLRYLDPYKETRLFEATSIAPADVPYLGDRASQAAP